MNIIGEGFPQAIVTQIERRQAAYGSGWSSERSDNRIKYLNGNTSWVKLVSGVNIDTPSIIQNQGLSAFPTGNSTAQAYVLFSGTKGGLSGIGFNGAYGMLGTSLGERPMMGITSAEIQHENRGSIRRASVKIRAFNKLQFEVIDTLYLRLGFSVLLEWGHTYYLNNNGGLEDAATSGISLENDFINGGVSYTDFLKKIQNQRLASFGNYDAMFAKVCNFHWSFLPDGSYDITVDLVSIGDVVESFKVNSLVSDSSFSSIKTNATSLIKAFTIIGTPEANAYVEILRNGLSTTLGRFLLALAFRMATTDIFYIPPSSPDFENFNPPAAFEADGVAVTYQGMDQRQYYVRFATLLKFIQDKIVYSQRYANGSISNDVPILNFNIDPQLNLMTIIFDFQTSGGTNQRIYQTSIDPTICLTSVLDYGLPNEHQGEGFEQPAYVSSGATYSYGKIMDIYINIKFLLSKLEELKSVEENKVVLIDFLTEICVGINGALGGVNALEVNIDETTNEIIIRDANPLPDGDKIIANRGLSTAQAQFQFVGYRTGATGGGKTGTVASFIKDFSLTTELSPATSTMITVGATANAAVVGETSTAFSRFNAGLTDRFKEKISDSESAAQTSATLSALYKNKQDLLSRFNESYTIWYDFVKNLKNKIFSPPEKESIKNVFTNLLRYRRQIVEIDNQISGTPDPIQPGTGFIPFNMSLTVDGLSGMKIYNKFYIDTDALPTTYPRNSEFLIKNIRHKIENNKWTTKLDSITISKGTSSTSPSPSTSPAAPPSVTPTPARKTITATGTVKKK